MIETKRLRLREYQDSDFDELTKIIGDKETMKYYPKPYDEKGVKRWIDWSKENYQKYGFGWLVLESKLDGSFIGDCGITMQNIDGKLLPEIGYHINKKYWKQGYGKEAGIAIRDWGFNNTKFDALYSYMNIENIGSYRLAESLGMNRIKEYQDDDEICAVYEIKRENWEKLYKCNSK